MDIEHILFQLRSMVVSERLINKVLFPNEIQALRSAIQVLENLETESKSGNMVLKNG